MKHGDELFSLSINRSECLSAFQNPKTKTSRVFWILIEYLNMQGLSTWRKVHFLKMCFWLERGGKKHHPILPVPPKCWGDQSSASLLLGNAVPNSRPEGGVPSAHCKALRMDSPTVWPRASWTSWASAPEQEGPREASKPSHPRTPRLVLELDPSWERLGQGGDGDQLPAAWLGSSGSTSTALPPPTRLLSPVEICCLFVFA